jgi:hypothetical protein
MAISRDGAAIASVVRSLWGRVSFVASKTKGKTFHKHLQGSLLSVDEVEGDWSKTIQFL